MSAARAKRRMAASSQVTASRVALDVMRAGGTAADACIAMDAVLHVTEPTSTGLGGDFFALYYNAATGEVTALNGSGRAPLALTREYLRAHHQERFGRSGLAVTVPGVCAAWFDLSRSHGKRSVAELLRPAIRLAEDGFAVGAVTAEMWQRKLSELQSHELTVNGRAPHAGETFRNAGLARVFRKIAVEGPDGFYRGDVAEAIVRATQAAGGVLEPGDLAAHTSTWQTAISTKYRAARVWECPPNSQGLVAVLALSLLDGFAPLPAFDPLRWHRQIEALRLSFADARAFVADPELSPAPIDRLLSADYIAHRRQEINADRAALHASVGVPFAMPGTVCGAAVDDSGNACSFVSSHFMGFGTGLIPEGCGFILQNRGLGFAVDPEHPNVLGPGKRPYHTIIPGMMTTNDGELLAAFGVMGGFMQPQGHVQIVTGLIDDDADPQDVLDRPRFSIEPAEEGGRVQLEDGVPRDIIEDLRARGHEVVSDVPSYGRARFGRGQIVLVSKDGLSGGSDRRADGCAIGD